jgi:hypothetical protein
MNANTALVMYSVCQKSNISERSADGRGEVQCVQIHLTGDSGSVGEVLGNLRGFDIEE